jgi:hypothetical protein
VIDLRKPSSSVYTEKVNRLRNAARELLNVLTESGEYKRLEDTNVIQEDGRELRLADLLEALDEASTAV